MANKLFAVWEYDKRHDLDTILFVAVAEAERDAVAMWDFAVPEHCRIWASEIDVRGDLTTLDRHEMLAIRERLQQAEQDRREMKRQLEAGVREYLLRDEWPDEVVISSMSQPNRDEPSREAWDDSEDENAD